MGSTLEAPPAEREPFWAKKGPPGYEEMVEGHSVPDGLELKQVNVFVRHGERTPVRKRLAGQGGLPQGQWDLCRLSKRFGAAAVDFSPPTNSASSSGDGGEPIRGMMKVRQQLQRQTKNEGTLWTPSECYWGELTDLGKETAWRFGDQLRRLYIEKLGFVPSTPKDEDPRLFLRSTTIPRAQETAYQIVRAMWPGPTHLDASTSASPSWTPTFVMRLIDEESLFPNTICRPLKVLDERFANEAAAELNDSLKSLDPILGHLTQNGQVRIDGRPRVNGLLDTYTSAKAHGLAAPKDFEQGDTLARLERATVYEWFNGYGKSLMFGKLAMGRLLGDLRETMDRRRRGSSELRFALNSCHDTSLGGMMSALDCYDKRWPPFTSHITVELFGPPSSSRSSFLSSFLSVLPSLHSPNPHFVRLRYNGRTLKLPACASSGTHREGSDGELCTWEAFDKAVGKWSMTAEEWEKACKGNIKELEQTTKREG